MRMVSVIIPLYNAEKTIHECVETVLENDYDNFEVIVVDDKSSDKSLEILEAIKDSRLRKVFNQDNSGASFSRNVGIKDSKGEIVILLDSDSYVDRDWIGRHEKAHEEIGAEIIGGGIVGVHETVFGKCDAFCNWWTSVPYRQDYFLTKLHIPTNNISIKKDVFKKVGYFSEELRLGGEDAEFCHRALKNGVKMYFKSDLTVYHYDRDDWPGYLKHQQNWGKHAVRMRKGQSMEYSFLMPNSYFMAWVYILPLAILYTLFIIAKWVRYRPSVLLYSPMILVGKIAQTAAIKDSFKTEF